MENNLELSIDLRENTLKVDENPPLRLKKNKGLLILDFLNKHKNQSFTPTQVRLNIEGNQGIALHKRNDETSYLINQACDYIPSTDRQTINDVVRELRRNEMALDKAYELHDESQIDYLLEQKFELEKYLRKSVNLNYTIKNINQARVNNGKAIVRAMNRLMALIDEQSDIIAKKLEEKLIVNSKQVSLLT